MSDRRPPALRALDVPPRPRTSLLPSPFAERLAGREKRALGDVFGLTRFGVNLTRLDPGAISSLRHAHALQDELVYVLEGEPTLVTDAGETALGPGSFAGFPAGTGDAHQLVNRTDRVVWYLEVGDRTSGDEVTYPEEDLAGAHVDGRWRFTRKDGSAL